MSRHLLIITFWLASTAPLCAQPGTTSESEVQLQEIFIEANKEKLLGNWDKAIAKFEELLQKDPANHAAAYELARVHDAIKETEKAEAFAKIAVDGNPANIWYQMYLADIYQRRNKDKEAANIYQFLTTNNPDNREYYLKWAYYLVRAGEPAQAIKVYDDLEKKTGLTEEVSRHKHTLYMGMGDYKKAAKELEALVKAFPKNTAYYHMLALFYEQIKDREKAKAIYEQILTIAPDDARAKIALAGEAKGNNDINYLNSLKPVFENPNTGIDLKIKEILPFVKDLADKHDQILGTTLLALSSILERVHPNNAKAYSLLGDVLYYTGQKDRALEKYKKCLELDQNVWLVWEQVLYIYYERKDYELLVKTSEDALDLFPNQASAHYLNGVGYNGRGKNNEALSALNLAKMMSANNARLTYDIKVEMGKAHHQLKQYPQAVAAFEEALKINDKDSSVLNHYSRSLATQPSGDLTKAKELASRLVSSFPNIAAYEETYALVFYKMKDYKAAKEWLDKALQHGGDDDPSVLEHYGDVLYQSGNVQGAQSYWQKALDHGGKSEFLERKITEGKLYE